LLLDSAPRRTVISSPLTCEYSDIFELPVEILSSIFLSFAQAEDRVVNSLIFALKANLAFSKSRYRPHGPRCDKAAVLAEAETIF
jgi:hypothetical protein